MMANQNLSEWFGLSYASWLTLPRVLMEAMPEDWQERMAQLLNEYDESFDNTKVGGDIAVVEVVGKGRNNRYTRFSNELLNYRRPNRVWIESVRAGGRG